MREIKLTPKQDAFVKAYLLNGGNASQAAISAGYKPDNSTVIGAQNLTKPVIKKALEDNRLRVEANLYRGVIDELNELREEVKRLKTVIGESSSNRMPKAENRYSVMHSAGFKCQCCGAKPSKENNVVLHLDHIIPFSKGGGNEVDNLQVLCRDCNIAKSNYFDFNHAKEQ